jgi:predicted 3-demethylubiquinone-9 3-methyltransferase (glyoxalase superfamily)
MKDPHKSTLNVRLKTFPKPVGADECEKRYLNILNDARVKFLDAAQKRKNKGRYDNINVFEFQGALQAFSRCHNNTCIHGNFCEGDLSKHNKPLSWLRYRYR